MTSGAEYRGASSIAIQRHYDAGNDFFALWLDKTRSYSCALWEGSDDTLDAAQERKLDFMATAAAASNASRVLDVGCGWGGLMQRLVGALRVKQVVGLTLSDAQADYIESWADERYEVLRQNWIDYRPDEYFDAVISVGAFEHFVDFGLDRTERVSAYREFFESCSAWLRPGGRIALQTIIKGNNTRMDRQTVRDLLFMADYIFPESELPWLSEIMEASERLFDVISIRNHPQHYSRTCGEWLRRMQENINTATELVGSEMVRDYQRYLASAVSAFDNRHLGLARIVFQRM
jgi:cyclopropane-fatty-acyl-phospholipid synthase